MDSAKEPAPVAKKPEKSVTFQAASPTPKPVGLMKATVQKSNQPIQHPIPPFTAKTVIIEERSCNSPSVAEEVSKRSVQPVQAKSPIPPHQQQQDMTAHEQNPGSPSVEVRPESPSPDYSNSPSPSPSPPRVRSPGVDMESLESFRLKNPPKNVQKPPPFYFNESAMKAAAAAAAAAKGQASKPNGHYNGNAPDDKMVRMAAYPSAYSRPDPARLGFLGNGGGGKGPAPPVPNGVKAEVILHRELEDALSRCNMNTCNNPSNAKMMVHHNQNQNAIIQNSSNFCNGKCTSNGNKTANQVNGKPNGGILKMSNGSGGGTSSNKTISFGGRY